MELTIDGSRVGLCHLHKFRDRLTVKIDKLPNLHPIQGGGQQRHDPQRRAGLAGSHSTREGSYRVQPSRRHARGRKRRIGRVLDQNVGFGGRKGRGDKQNKLCNGNIIFKT